MALPNPFYPSPKETNCSKLYLQAPGDAQTDYPLGTGRFYVYTPFKLVNHEAEGH